MSKNSGKTRSEGDADSLYAEISPHACSSTSFRSKKGIEGGPYGDIPPDPNRQGAYKDYVVFMLQNNEDSETSEDSECDEQELYSLRNEYLQKLNIVRKRLNLTEISYDGDKYFSSDFDQNQRCTITEITEEDSKKPEKFKGSAKKRDQVINQIHEENIDKNEDERTKSILSESPEVNSTKETYSESPSSRSEDVEIKTLHPFSLCYNKMEADSISNLLDLEYNPPKKKSCFRLQTPKLPSASESNIPYHTKVSLHEDLFKKISDKKCGEITTANKQISTAFIEKFTVTREVQCNESDLDNKERFKSPLNLTKSNKTATTIPETSTNVQKITSFSSPARNSNLFPEVIVKYESPRQIIISSGSTTASSAAVAKFSPQVNPPNFIEDSESYDTVTTSTTILGGAITKRKALSKERHIRNAGQMLQELNTSNINRETNNALNEKIHKKSFIQYISYRKDKKRAKTTPIKIKTAVPFGPVILQDFEKVQNLDSRFYLINSTSGSDEEKYVRELYTEKLDSPYYFNKKMKGHPCRGPDYFHVLGPLCQFLKKVIKI